MAISYPQSRSGRYYTMKLKKNDKLGKLGKYDLILGSIEMEIDREHRGEVEVEFAEQNSDNPKIFKAALNTREGMLYEFTDWGRESKLYPGIIHLQNWNIDSTDAVRISEEFFRAEKDFRYDKIGLRSSDNFSIGDVANPERWSVYLSDYKNKIRYKAEIYAYTGEVLYHSIQK